MQRSGEELQVMINMFKESVVVVACFAAVVLAGPAPLSENVESVYGKANEGLESVKSEAAYDKEIEIILKSVFDSMQNQADDSLIEAFGETVQAARRIVEDNEYDSGSDIIEKIKKCSKQVMEKCKDRTEAIRKEVKKVVEDMSKIRECKGTRAEMNECIKKNIALVRQDLTNLLHDSTEQIQWMINEVLPDFYRCMTA